MSIDKLKEELQSILNLDDCVGYEDIINKLSEEISFLEKENNDLNRRIVKLGYNPLVSSYLLEDTFKTLEEDPLDQKILDLFKD